MNYFEPYKDVWEMHKKYSSIKQSDDLEWDNLIKAANVIIKRYDGSEFVRNLVAAVLGELERVSKGECEK